MLTIKVDADGKPTLSLHKSKSKTLETAAKIAKAIAANANGEVAESAKATAGQIERLIALVR